MSQWNEREARQILPRLIDGYLSSEVDFGPTFFRYREAYLDECPLDFPGDEDEFFKEIYSHATQVELALEDGGPLFEPLEADFREWLSNQRRLCLQPNQ